VFYFTCNHDLSKVLFVAGAVIARSFILSNYSVLIYLSMFVSRFSPLLQRRVTAWQL